jgi:hypothetical protein
MAWLAGASSGLRGLSQSSQKLRCLRVRFHREIVFQFLVEPPGGRIGSSVLLTRRTGHLPHCLPSRLARLAQRGGGQRADRRRRIVGILERGECSIRRDAQCGRQPAQRGHLAAFGDQGIAQFVVVGLEDGVALAFVAEVGGAAVGGGSWDGTGAGKTVPTVRCPTPHTYY